MTFSCWPHWRLRLCRREGGWQVDADFNVGYGWVGGEGRGWRVHAGFIAGCRVGGEGGVAGSCWLQCRLWMYRRSGMGGWRVHAGFTVGRGSVGEEGGGRGGGFLLASLKTEDGGFLLDTL